MKKTELLALLGALAVSASPLSGQVKFQIVEIGQILTSPDQFQGKVIALHGTIGTVSADQKTFTVLGTGAPAANAQSVSVSLPRGSQPDLPIPGRETVVMGQIGKTTGGIGFIAAQVFTNRADVQRILTQGSIIRPPGKRPGDNLGRDAQRADNSK